MNNGQQEQIISDKQYIGVYDGHNGDWAASYAKEKMHTHLEKCAFIANGIAPDAPQHELEEFELASPGLHVAVTIPALRLRPLHELGVEE